MSGLHVHPEPKGHFGDSKSVCGGTSISAHTGSNIKQLYVHYVASTRVERIKEMQIVLFVYTLS